MVTVPLGQQAYKRTSTASPEIKLINRYVEQNPTNLREHVSLIGRPGTKTLATFAGGTLRGTYSKRGVFSDALFVVSGSNFYRYDQDGTLTHITGTVGGTGTPHVTWMKGIGYEFLFISDDTNLQYYSTRAAGTLTLSGGGITNQVIDINGTYYSWSATVNAGTPNGTSGSPYLALLGTGLTADADSLANMAMLLNFTGDSGVTYSSAVPAANTSVTAVSTDTSLILTAQTDGSGGNSVTTSVFSGSFLSWTSTTLTGGGGTALQTVTVPDSQPTKALASLSGYVLVSIGNTQKFYWLEPGNVTIDPLNFAEKESNPDVITDMATVGDQALICGSGSTENWYATGTFAAPFAPVEGRVYQRGVIEGSLVVINDSAVFVGDDLKAYSVGYQFGGTAQWGVHRISTHGIEERIRRCIHFEEGLTP